MSDADKLVRRSDETGMRIFDVNAQAQIDRYIVAQDPPKRDDIEAIQRLILAAAPNCKLWFLDGRDSDAEIRGRQNPGILPDRPKLKRNRNFPLPHGNRGQEISARNLWRENRQGEGHRLLRQVQAPQGLKPRHIGPT
jgi:hypothetical protein